MQRRKLGDELCARHGTKYTHLKNNAIKVLFFASTQPLREGHEHVQWRSRQATVTFKEAAPLKMKALLLKVINGIYNGGLVEYRADNVKKKKNILMLCSRVKRTCESKEYKKREDRTSCRNGHFYKNMDNLTYTSCNIW